MMHNAPPILAQTCILIVIALVCAMGASVYQDAKNSEAASVLMLIGMIICLLGAIAIAGETAP